MIAIGNDVGSIPVSRCSDLDGTTKPVEYTTVLKAASASMQGLAPTGARLSRVDESETNDATRLFDKAIHGWWLGFFFFFFFFFLGGGVSGSMHTSVTVPVCMLAPTSRFDFEAC